MFHTPEFQVEKNLAKKIQQYTERQQRRIRHPAQLQWNEQIWPFVH